MCLNGVVASLPHRKVGGKVVTVSCAVRFETKLFSPLSTVPPPPSSPHLGPPATLASGGDSGGGGSSNTKDDGANNVAAKTTLIIVIPMVAALVFLFAIYFYLKRRKQRVKRMPMDNDEFRSSELVLFDLDTLKAATNNFSDANWLGQGGFGPVYKGSLQNGEEIVVKRLSRSSMQGLVELRNEVILVAKLQHRNIVMLLGCCLEDQEKLLVYEYLPNTSLDKFLLDSARGQQLYWETRYKIIEGIGRGLLYLHEESRLGIIHGNLKANDILLDGDMNPKISGFGFAKLLGIDESQGIANLIAGTCGYMAPEYFMHGLFSTKSDVFNYGVLVLEIVTGRKFFSFRESGGLLSHVWQRWSEEKALEVTDPSLGSLFQPQEVLRCVQIGLLCTQHEPRERPGMASVVLMLSTYSVTLPAPSPPTFYNRVSTISEPIVVARNADFDVEDHYSDGEGRLLRKASENGLSISEIEPR